MTWQEVLEIVATHEHKSVAGKISSSSLATVALCGGSVTAQQLVRKIAKKYTSEGSALHYCAEHDITPTGAPPEALEKLEKARNLNAQLHMLGWDVYAVEEFLEDSFTCGTPDKIYKKRNGMAFDYLVVDWKFGHQYVADDLIQVRNYALLLSSLPGLETANIFTCIAQPSRDLANIVRVDLDAALNEVAAILRNAEKGERVPSSAACQFCCACGTFACPETQQASHELMKPEFASNMMESDLLKYGHMIPIMAKAVENFKENLRAYLEAGNQVDFARLVDGKNYRSVESMADVYSKLKEHVSPQELIAASELQIGKLEDLLFEKKICKRKDVKDKLADLLGDALKIKTGNKEIRFSK